MKLYEKLTRFLLVWTVFQDILLSFFYNTTNQLLLTKILFHLKDFLLIFLFLWGLIRVKIRENVFFTFTIYFSLLILYSVISIINGIEFISLISSLRGFLLLPCFLLIGFSIKKKNEFYSKLIKFLSKGLFIVSLFGIVDFVIDSYVFSTIPFWTDVIGIGRYFVDIKGQSDRLILGLPGNFYGQYGGDFFSQKRLVSFWGIPLTAAYVLIIPTLIYFLKQIGVKKVSYKTTCSFLIVFLSVILTFTRAIIIPLVAVLLLLLFKKNKKIRKYVFFFMICCFILLIFSFDKVVEYLYDGSTVGHIDEFFKSLNELNFFGSGIGSIGISGGNATESSYLACLGQIGIIGLILYVIGNVVPIMALYKKYKVTGDNIYLCFVLIGIVMLITGIISEQLFAFTTICPYYISVGFLLGYNTQYNFKYKEIKL